MVRDFLAGHFEAIQSSGIGFRHVREGILGSLVVDVILVSKIAINIPLGLKTLDLKYLNFFGTDVLLLPSPAWNFCSPLPSENECMQSKNLKSQVAVSCGWCNLLLSCMQGICFHHVTRILDIISIVLCYRNQERPFAFNCLSPKQLAYLERV